MSEEVTMCEELTWWRMYIEKMQEAAIEMQSGEQDKDYVSDLVTELFDKVAKFKPDENGVNDSYLIDFEHPTNPRRKVVFEFAAYIEEDGDE